MKAPIPSAWQTLLPCTLAFAIGCQAPDSKAPQAPAPTKVLTSEVVATYLGKTITLDQVDVQIKRELDKLEVQRYRLREGQINQIIIQDLVEAEAKKQGGIPAQKLIQNYAEEHTKPPTLEEAEAFFNEKVKATKPSAKFEDFRDRIIGFLGSEADKKTLTTLFDKLKKDAGVSITLAKPPGVALPPTAPKAPNAP